MGTEHENRPNGQWQSLVDRLAKHISAPDRQVLEAGLRDLPSRDRLLLKLRFEFGLSARRISTLMSFPTQAHVERRCDALCETLAAGQRDA
jgi:DNA-directed RNA polymerase specialized sigma24 family protein